ncbi:MAG: hypothetical protein JWR26_4269 [Pedosphaera sp.]|nr:hypothetical protein [Pedosphaera sp.]
MNSAARCDSNKGRPLREWQTLCWLNNREGRFFLPRARRRSGGTRNYRLCRHQRRKQYGSEYYNTRNRLLFAGLPEIFNRIGNSLLHHITVCGRIKLQSFGRPFGPLVKRVKTFLTGTALTGCLLAFLYLLLFTTAGIPTYLMKPAGSPENPSDRTSQALVLRWVRHDSLKPGDLILVESQDGDATTRKIRKLEKIAPPDESERLKAGGQPWRASHGIAQAILDMDFKPKYWISSEAPDDPAGLVRIEESQIKGKVVYTFSK